MMRRFWLLTLGLIGLLIVDRWLKALALAGRTVDWPVGRFMLVENDAAVFSWPIPNALATDLMILAVLGLLWFAWRARRRQHWQVLVGVLFMIAGAGSNLYDRIVHKFVIDWAYLGPWWPVFNLADLLIFTGLVIIIWPKKLQLKGSSL